MNLRRSLSDKNSWDPAYRKKQVTSMLFLLVLAVVLLVAVVLSLWSGSYDTPLTEMIRGIFGCASDERINIVVGSVRLPRICTAVAAGAGLGVAGAVDGSGGHGRLRKRPGFGPG